MVGHIFVQRSLRSRTCKRIRAGFRRRPPDPSFRGKIEVAFKDSEAVFPEPVRAPEAAPNVLLIMGDDIGYGHMDVQVRAVDWHVTELALTALAAMLVPTTLTWSVLVLVLSKRPLRSGLWFYLGAFVATIAIGVIAAFLIGDAAAPPHPSGPPKLWVAVIDVVAAVALVALVVYYLRLPQPRARRKSRGPDV